MAIKPVADALMLELEPIVGENLDRHIGTEKAWYAHDFVPFDQGENYAFLGGRDWDAAQVTLPKLITDACEILLITKDNLAGYHREFVEHFILEDMWGQWIGRWTAEEHLHAIALREYFVVTREIDPVANEHVRFDHVANKGYRADHYSKTETLVFMAFFEAAHAVYCNNLAAQIEEPVLAGLITHIARDEERHEEFFANLVAHLLTFSHDETVDAIAARAAELEVIGADIDAYADKVHAVADGGIFGPDRLRQVISDRIIAWGAADEPALRGACASTRVPSLSMASDMLCYPGGASRLVERTAGPGPYAAAPANSSVRAARAISPVTTPRAHGWRWGHHPHVAASRAISTQERS